MAAGTLMYTTMMHILPEVYMDKCHDGHPHEHGHPEMAINNEEKSGVAAESPKKEYKPSKSVMLTTLLLGMGSAELLTLLPHGH